MVDRRTRVLRAESRHSTRDDAKCQVNHVPLTRALMQAVDVLRDERRHVLRGFELREAPMRGVRCASATPGQHRPGCAPNSAGATRWR